MYRTDIKQSEKDPNKLARNASLAQKLERAGVSLVLPQRDVNQKQEKRKIWEQELALIKESEGLITVLSDTRGLYLETGYAKALHKSIFGLKVEETREIPVNGWTAQWFDFIAENSDELITFLQDRKNILKK